MNNTSYTVITVINFSVALTICRLENRLQSIEVSVEWLNSRTKYRPNIAIICGSGFGSFADCVENADIFDYCNIPHFVTCSGQLLYFLTITVTIFM